MEDAIGEEFRTLNIESPAGTRSIGSIRIAPST